MNKKIPLSLVIKKIINPIFYSSDKKIKYKLTASLLFLLLSTAITLAVPFIYTDIIDHFVYHENDLTLPLLLILSYGLTQIISSLFSQLKSVLFTSVTMALLIENSLQMVKYISTLSMHFHLSHQSGSISKNVSRGINALTTLTSMTSFTLLPIFIQSIAICIIVAYQFNLWLLLFLLVSAIVYGLVSYYTSLPFLKSQEELIAQDSISNAKLIDILSQIHSIKYFSGEDIELKTYKKNIQAYSKSMLNNQKKISWMFFSQNTVIGIAYIIILLLGSYEHMQGTITIGEFVLLFSLTTQFFAPLASIGFYYNSAQSALVSIKKMFSYLNSESIIQDKAKAPDLVVSKGLIDFQAISFSYDSKQMLFDQFSLKVEPGQTLALVGRSGSGKSTLIKLLYRLYDLNAGKIVIDDQCIADVTKQSLRQAIAFVPQESTIFRLSLYENVTYPTFNVEHDKVISVLEQCGLSDVLARLPKGLDTIMGEEGLALSGGESQRVSIARALLSEAKIMVFDEATSALDTETESIIQQLVDRVCRDKTVIIIAHRLSTLRRADRIAVLQSSRIVESGTHQELLKQDGVYSGLWKEFIKDSD